MPTDIRKRHSTSSTDEGENFISLEKKPSIAKRKSFKSPTKSPFQSPERFHLYTPIPPLMAEEAVIEERQKARQMIAGDVSSPVGVEEDASPTKECPWVRDSGYTSDIFGLHHEIRDFLKYISPTEKEKRMREQVVRRINAVIVNLWPHAQVHVFGSYKTGLYLPTSDVDLVVFGRWPHVPLRTLEKAFIDAEIAEAEGIQVIDKAAVPIIKVIDKETEVRVDISFNMPNSILAVEFVKIYMNNYPTLRYLVFILKQFLNQRDLNEVYFGGVSSYSLVLMAISFLQLHPRLDARLPNANLGVLLLEFLELYGLNFNYKNVCIRLRDGGSYIQKSEFYRLEVKQRCPDKGLSIEDPYTAGNDISRGSYHSDKVAAAFEKAFFSLQHALLASRQQQQLQRGQQHHKKRQQSLLVNVIQLSPELVEYRRWIQDNF